MGPPVSTAMIGRTVVIGGFVAALALAGRPVWLVVLLGPILVAVWAAPLVLNPPRRQASTGVRVVQQKRPRPG